MSKRRVYEDEFNTEGGPATLKAFGIELDDLSDGQLHRLYGIAAGYSEVPPDIDEFIESDQYLGLGSSGVWPCWREALREIFPDPFTSPYSEIIWTGAIGTGKSTAAAVACLYDEAKLLHLSDPHRKFGLLPSTKIEFAVVNATLDLSENTTWDIISNMIIRSPYFKEKMDEANSIPGNNAQFPHRSSFVVGSRMSHVLGQAVYAALLEELNFHAAQKNQAYDVYTGAKRRMHSRFMRAGGRLPGHMLLVSSSKDEASFLDALVKEVENDELTKIYSLPLWEAHRGVPGKDIYSGDTFSVFAGSSTKDPFILKEDTELDEVETGRVVEVPLEFKGEFEKDIVNSLRDIAGQRVSSHWKLFGSVEMLDKALCVENIFTKEVIQLSTDPDRHELKDSLSWSKYLKTRDQPHKLRYVHLDMATANRMGFAIGYVSDHVVSEVRKHEGSPNEVIRWRWPVITLEGVVAIEPVIGKYIPFFKVREFLKELFNNGVRLHVTADLLAMSLDTITLLNSIGIKADYLSVDKTKAPYASLHLAVMEARWRAPDHSIMRDELQSLLDVGSKYDHPPKGSKDVSDSAAGVTAAIIAEVTGAEEQIDKVRELGKALESKPSMHKGTLIETLTELHKRKGRLKRRF